MNTVLKNPERLDVVDALRGFALLAIVLIHNLEHYNIFYIPEFMPLWLSKLDKGIWDSVFFLFSGKAYAVFSLLFGFSFYIQFRNAEKKGIDFRWRFAWRMLLLFLIAQIHALFYDGDILVLYSLVGLFLIPTSRLSDRTIFIIGLILIFQPFEWGRMMHAMSHPNYSFNPNMYLPFAMISTDISCNGTFWEVLRNNIWTGQLYSNIWQIENGRICQAAALFLFGMLLGRRKYFIRSEVSVSFWKQSLIYACIVIIPFYILRTLIAAHISNEFLSVPFLRIFSSLFNFAFATILVSAFTLIWFDKMNGHRWQKFIIPYGRMSLTNYIMQSIIGACLYYGFGFGLYKLTGASISFLIGIAMCVVQFLFSRYWMSTHKQGPIEYIWKKATWMKFRR